MNIKALIGVCVLSLMTVGAFAAGWTTIPFVANNFQGNSVGTWTVIEGNIRTNRYTFNDKTKTLTWSLYVTQSQVFGNDPGLLLAMPGGKSARSPQGCTFWYSSNTVMGMDSGIGFAYFNGPYARLFRANPGEVWPTGELYMAFTCTVEVL